MSMKFVFLPVMWHRSHTGCLWQWCHRGGTQTWTLYGRGHPDTDHRTPFMTPQHTLATKRICMTTGKALAALKSFKWKHSWWWMWQCLWLAASSLDLSLKHKPSSAGFVHPSVCSNHRHVRFGLCGAHLSPSGLTFLSAKSLSQQAPPELRGTLCPPFYFFGSINIHHRQCMDKNENQDTVSKP